MVESNQIAARLEPGGLINDVPKISEGALMFALTAVGATLGAETAGRVRIYMAQTEMGKRGFLEGTKIEIEKLARQRISRAGATGRVQQRAYREESERDQDHRDAYDRIMNNRQ